MEATTPRRRVVVWLPFRRPVCSRTRQSFVDDRCFHFVDHVAPNLLDLRSGRGLGHRLRLTTARQHKPWRCGGHLQCIVLGRAASGLRGGDRPSSGYRCVPVARRRSQYSSPTKLGIRSSEYSKGDQPEGRSAAGGRTGAPNEGGASAPTALAQNQPAVTEGLRYGESDGDPWVACWPPVLTATPRGRHDLAPGA
jgi:hypothetical protein